jgi:hypothetical protein
MHSLVFFDRLLPRSSSCHVFVGGVSGELELIEVPVNHYIEVERLPKLFVPSGVLLGERKEGGRGIGKQRWGEGGWEEELWGNR